MLPSPSKTLYKALADVGYAESTGSMIMIHMCEIVGHLWVVVKMLLRNVSGREISSRLHSRRPASHRSHDSPNKHHPIRPCCAAMLIGTSALRPLLTVAVGLGSQIPPTTDTYPHTARE